jgi:hypothetical protein
MAFEVVNATEVSTVGGTGDILEAALSVRYDYACGSGCWKHCEVLLWLSDTYYESTPVPVIAIPSLRWGEDQRLGKRSVGRRTHR